MQNAINSLQKCVGQLETQLAETTWMAPEESQHSSKGMNTDNLNSQKPERQEKRDLYLFGKNVKILVDTPEEVAHFRKEPTQLY